MLFRSEIDIQTSNLDGQAIAATGTVKLYRIVEPKKVPRRDLLGGGQVYRPQPVRNSRPNSGAKPARSVFPIVDSVDPTDFRQWAIGDLINEQDYKTGESGTTKINFKLPTGLYRAILESKDAYGKPVRSELNLKVLSPQQNELGFKLPHVFVIESNEVHPGETWKALWGTGYPTGTALVEFERMGKKLKSYWTAPGKTQSLLELPIDESMRGGVSVRVTFVRDNRLYTESTLISIPWDNKQLALKWERFRNKLEPGAKEKIGRAHV